MKKAVQIVWMVFTKTMRKMNANNAKLKIVSTATQWIFVKNVLTDFILTKRLKSAKPAKATA